MMKISKALLPSFVSVAAIAFVQTASAALFDTLESVDTLNTIAATKRSSDRMPASKEKPSVDSSATEKTATSDSETKN